MNITINIQAPEIANAILTLAEALSGKQVQTIQQLAPTLLFPRVQ